MSEPLAEQGLRTPDSEDSARPSPRSLAPTLPLLVEIGCEEIPARFLRQAERQLLDLLRSALSTYRLDFPPATPIQTYSTPRRLVAFVPGVLDRGTDLIETIEGPPTKAAFDPDGKPTRAAEGFAGKHGATVKDLVQVSKAEGEYVALRRTLHGRLAHEVLPGILKFIIAEMDFPKSMHWEKSGVRFVRPIGWLLALLGEGDQARTISFEIAGVTSGNLTYGHRVLGPGPVAVTGFTDYSNRLRHMGVEFDPEKRRQAVRNEIKVLLEDSGLSVVQDKKLEDWVVNSTEWPRAVLGNFEERFLKLPREILVTVMRDHQKYFAVEDQQGNLQPLFIAVLNLDRDEKGLIRAGHERVLTARFSDAEFFWNADQKLPLPYRLPHLEKVTYQEKLGSYADKLRRMAILSDELSLLTVVTPEKISPVSRAIRLSKCDLTTQMVQEFPELQGVVGGLYARAQGEPREVYEAIYDHYLPQGFEDRCPRTVTGALVSFIDKFDSIMAGFAVGLEPTGSSDPFALRRHASGLIKVLVEFELPIKLKGLIVSAYARLEVSARRPGNEVYDAFFGFLEDRLRYYLQTVRMIRYDTVRAVLAAGWDVPIDAVRRAEALEGIRDSQDFVALSQAARRTRNILGKSASAQDWQPGEVEDAHLVELWEKHLFYESRRIGEQVAAIKRSGEYRTALGRLATLRPAVDDFFDRVLVMHEDRVIRQNRLRLLATLDRLFSSIADLSQIESSTLSVVGASTSEQQGLGTGD